MTHLSSRSILILPLIALAFAWQPTAGRAATYYVDAIKGNDRWEGTKSVPDGTRGPWKSLARVSRAMLRGGDAVRLRCGSTWREPLSIANVAGSVDSGFLEVGGFGLCSKTTRPIIRMSVRLDPSKWMPSSGAVYEISLRDAAQFRPAEQSVTQVFVNGQLMPLAHYPNSDSANAATTEFLYADNITPSRTQIVDEDLRALTGLDLRGASAILRTADWRYETCLVESAASNALVLGRCGGFFSNGRVGTIYPLNRDWGYLLTGKRWMLDSPGEWMVDEASGKLFLWMPEGSDPRTQRIPIEISVREKKSYVMHSGLTIARSAFIRVTGLSIRNAADQGVFITHSNNVVLDDIQVGDSGENGVFVSSSGDVEVARSSIVRSAFNGVHAAVENPTEVARRVRIVENTIADSGGTGLPRHIQAAVSIDRGVLDSVVSRNTITRSAGGGIHFSEAASVVNNVVTLSCTRLNDCAAIYTARSSTLEARGEVQGNIVNAVVGDARGTNHPLQTLATGISIDDEGHHIDIVGNTVIGADYGIGLHRAYANRIVGNVLYGARKSQIALLDDDPRRPWIKENTISDNQIFPTSEDARSLSFASVHFDNALTFATLDRNSYSGLHGAAKFDTSYVTAAGLPCAPVLIPTLQSDRAHKNCRGTMSFAWFKQATDQDRDSLEFNQVRAQGYVPVAPADRDPAERGAAPLSLAVWRWYAPLASVAAAPTEPGCSDGDCLLVEAKGRTGLWTSSEAYRSVLPDRTYRLRLSTLPQRAGLNLGASLMLDADGNGRLGDNTDLRLVPSPAEQFLQTGWQTLEFIFRPPSILVARPVVAQVRLSVDGGTADRPVSYLLRDITFGEVVQVETAGSRVLVNSGSVEQWVTCPNVVAEKNRCGAYRNYPEQTPVAWPVRLAPYSSKVVVWLAAN
jgi:hypothetical protein